MDSAAILPLTAGNRADVAYAPTRILNTFLDTGPVEASLYTFQPLDFNVGLGWPALAKPQVTIPVLIVVIVVAMM